MPVLTKKDMNEIGRIANRKGLEALIPNFNKKVPVDYSKRRLEEETKKKEDKNNNAKDLLINSIEYYNKNNRDKATFSLGDKSLEEELDLLTEDQLFEVQAILDFAHDPFKGNRFIYTIPDHEKMNHLIGLCKKRIPGFEERVKLAKLETKETEIQKEKRMLMEQIELKQKKHSENILRKRMLPKPEETFICEVCGKDCSNKSGLSSHMKTHPKKE